MTAVALKSTMTGSDPIGQVYIGRDVVLRNIYPESVPGVRALLGSGLIAELVARNLFPETDVAPEPMLGAGMTLRHRRLHPLILMPEWSSWMLRDAALAVLEVNRIARRYGYETKDAHLYNVAFSGTRPMFFDLGSFVRIGAPWVGWRAYDEFVRAAIFPLALRRQAGSWMRLPLAELSAEYVIKRKDYFALRWGILVALLPMPFIGRVLDFYGRILSLGGQSEGQLAARHNSAVRRLAIFLIRHTRWLERKTTNFGRLCRRVQRESRVSHTTRWDGYQDDMFDARGMPVLAHRFQRICAIIKELAPESTLELGGNRGALSLSLFKRGIVKRVICTDYDEGAVNKAYESFRREQSEDCAVATLDFLSDNQSIKIPPVSERFRAHTVIALAITHHLLLTQGITIELLLNRLASFCENNVIVEFMPLGLWDGSDGSPTPPSWYTRDWFAENFRNFFEVQLEEQLEANRIVFVGRKRN
jgi:hypothetical protein